MYFFSLLLLHHYLEMFSWLCLFNVYHHISQLSRLLIPLMSQPHSCETFKTVQLSEALSEAPMTFKLWMSSDLCFSPFDTNSSTMCGRFGIIHSSLIPIYLIVTYLCPNFVLTPEDTQCCNYYRIHSKTTCENINIVLTVTMYRNLSL